MAWREREIQVGWGEYLPIDKRVIDAKVLDKLLEHGGEFCMGVDLVFTRKHACRVDLTTIPTKGCHIELLMDDNTEKSRALSLFYDLPKRARVTCVQQPVSLFPPSFHSPRLID